MLLVSYVILNFHGVVLLFCCIVLFLIDCTAKSKSKHIQNISSSYHEHCQFEKEIITKEYTLMDVL